MKNKYIIGLTMVALSFAGCTKLNEDLNGQVGSAGVSGGNVSGLLGASYAAMIGPYQAPWNWAALHDEDRLYRILFQNIDGRYPGRKQSGIRSH